MFPVKERIDDTQFQDVIVRIKHLSRPRRTFGSACMVPIEALF